MKKILFSSFLVLAIFFAAGTVTKKFLATDPTVIHFIYHVIFGQPNERETMQNRIVPNRGFGMGGIHVGVSGETFIFDSGNNRILGFHTFTGDTSSADIVIGQPSATEKGTVNGATNF